MRERKTDLSIAVALFAGNLLILGPWIFAEFSDQPWNNGYIYIAIARLFRDYKWTWNPLHYGGAPFHYLYPPLFHVLVGAVPFVSLARAFHLVTAIGYALAPVCLYVLTLTLFRSRLLATFAAVAYSVFPSPVYAFLPAWRNIALPYAHAPWSFVDLIAFEEAGHAFALPIMFLAVAAAWRGRWRAASFLAAAVFLTNWPALIGFGFALAGIVVARRAAAHVVALIGAAYGLSAFWMTPGYFVSSSLLNRIVLRHTLTAAPWNRTTLLILALAAGLICLSFWRRVLPELGLVWTWLALSGAVVVCYTVSGNYLLPSPHRYMLEFNAACVLAIVSLISLLPLKLQLPVMAVLSVAGLGASFGFFSQPWTFERPSQYPRTGVAWQVADWLNHNTPQHNAGTSRVLASGELDSTLALWSDVPQAGGSGQDVSNFLIWAAERQVVYGCAPDSERIAELWLRALNVHYFVVHLAASREYFHWYAQPEKFAALRVAWDNGAGDTIYQTPAQPEAVVVDLDAMRRLPPLHSTADARFLAAYVNWAAGKRPASIRWDGVDSATIDSTLAPGEAVLVRVNNDPGWRAAGAGASVASDPLGFLLIRGAAPHLELRLGASWDTWLGRAITVLTIVLLLARVSGFWIAGFAVLPALGAYLVLLAGVPPTAAVAEDAFVHLQPPLINPGGIVDSEGGIISVYGLNFGGKTDSVHVWLGDREAEVVYHSPNMINFRLAPETPPNTALSIEVNGCRGNEFGVATRTR
jgi:hypothetical protein